MGDELTGTGFTAELTAFVEAEYAGVLRAAYLLTGSVDAAQDLAQTALAKTCDRGLRGTPIEDLGAYLHRSMVNAHISASRRFWRREVATAEPPERLVADPSLDRVLDRQELKAALAGLPARQRTALVLRYLLDLPDAEVADLLGCRPTTVKTLTARGLRAVREALGTGLDSGLAGSTTPGSTDV